MNKPEPTTLTPLELDSALKAIGRKGQAPRLVRYLSANQKSPTVFVNSNCAIGNISDIAAVVNPVLYKHGLLVACEKPPKPILNRFGDPSNMFLWSLFRLDKASADITAANDDAYLGK